MFIGQLSGVHLHGKFLQPSRFIGMVKAFQCVKFQWNFTSYSRAIRGRCNPHCGHCNPHDRSHGRSCTASTQALVSNASGDACHDGDDVSRGDRDGRDHLHVHRFPG